MYVCILCVYGWMYVCMYVCMYICMYANINNKNKNKICIPSLAAAQFPQSPHRQSSAARPVQAEPAARLCVWTTWPPRPPRQRSLGSVRVRGFLPTAAAITYNKSDTIK